jgi:hypothetical protein
MATPLKATGVAIVVISQNIDDLLGKILRIDVDHPSHSFRRPAGCSRG